MAPITIKRVSAEAKPLTVRVDVTLDRRLQAAAAREGISVSDFVREAITERLDRAGAESSLWDRIAPSVVQREPRRRRAGRTGSRSSDLGTHEEMSAGLEANAAQSWRRADD